MIRPPRPPPRPTQHLPLPLFPGMADDDVSYVCDRLKARLEEKAA